MKRTAPFSKAAIRNGCIAGVVGLAPIGVIAYGNAIVQTCVPGNSDYEAGTGLCTAKNRMNDDIAAKQEKVDISARIQERVAKAEAKPAAKSDYDQCLEYKKQWPTAYDCDGIKSYRSPAELVRLAKSQQLGYKCKAALKASLKDPQS